MYHDLKSLLVILISINILTACAGLSGSQDRSLSIPSEVDLVLTHRDRVKEQPSSYLDRTVLIQGSVDEILSGNAFIIKHGPIFRRTQLLVIDPRSSQLNVTKGQEVEVVGDVKLFNARQFERQYSINLQDNVFGQYQDQAGIVATSIQSL